MFVPGVFQTCSLLVPVPLEQLSVPEEQPLFHFWNREFLFQSFPSNTCLLISDWLLLFVASEVFLNYPFLYTWLVETLFLFQEDLYLFLEHQLVFGFQTVKLLLHLAASFIVFIAHTYLWVFKVVCLDTPFIIAYLDVILCYHCENKALLLLSTWCFW